jgi:hypothetical protein
MYSNETPKGRFPVTKEKEKKTSQTYQPSTSGVSIATAAQRMRLKSFL